MERDSPETKTTMSVFDNLFPMFMKAVAIESFLREIYIEKKISHLTEDCSGSVVEIKSNVSRSQNLTVLET